MIGINSNAKQKSKKGMKPSQFFAPDNLWFFDFLSMSIVIIGIKVSFVNSFSYYMLCLTVRFTYVKMFFISKT